MSVQDEMRALARRVGISASVANLSNDAANLLDEYEKKIKEHNERMDLQSTDQPKTAPEGLRFLAEWFDALYQDTGSGNAQVQQDLRRWADEFDGVFRSAIPSAMPITDGSPQPSYTEPEIPWMRVYAGQLMSSVLGPFIESAKESTRKETDKASAVLLSTVFDLADRMVKEADSREKGTD